MALKRTRLVLTLCLTFIFFLQVAASQEKAQQKKSPAREWWNMRHPGDPLNSPNAKKLPRISVSGNRFVDPQGKPLLLKGLSIADPDKIEYQGHWTKTHFEKV